MSLSPHGHTISCTGFMVSDTIMLTAGHCIPADLRFQGAPCHGRLFAYFAVADKAADTHACKHIMAGSLLRDISKNESDYALIELETSPGRPPLPISMEGVQDQQNYILHRMEFFQNRVISLTTIMTAQLNNIMHPSTQTPLSPTIIMTAAINNAGSGPILNQNGYVVGILQPYTPQISSQTLDKMPTMMPFHLVTNLAALPALQHGRLSRHNTYPKATEKLLHDILQQTLTTINLPKEFDWQIHTKPSSRPHSQTYVITPKCVRYMPTTTQLPIYQIVILFEPTKDWRFAMTPYITSTPCRTIGPLYDGSMLLSSENIWTSQIPRCTETHIWTNVTPPLCIHSK